MFECQLSERVSTSLFWGILTLISASPLSEHIIYSHGEHGPLHAESVQHQNLVSLLTAPPHPGEVSLRLLFVTGCFPGLSSSSVSPFKSSSWILQTLSSSLQRPKTSWSPSATGMFNFAAVGHYLFPPVCLVAQSKHSLWSKRKYFNTAKLRVCCNYFSFQVCSLVRLIKPGGQVVLTLSPSFSEKATSTYHVSELHVDCHSSTRHNLETSAADCLRFPALSALILAPVAAFVLDFTLCVPLPRVFLPIHPHVNPHRQPPTFWLG